MKKIVTNLKLKNWTFTELAIITLVVVAFFFRFYKFGAVPVGTYWDETAMLVDLKSIVATGKDIHGLPWFQTIFPSYGDYKLPLYLWLTILPSKLFGVSLVMLRLTSALAGLGSILIAALLTKRLLSLFSNNQLFSRLAALSTALILAISPWSFMFSRTAFEGHLSQFFLASSFLCFLYVAKKPWLAILGGILGALAVYGYYATTYVWLPVSLAATLLSLSFSAKEKRKSVTAFSFSSFVLFFILLQPLVSSQWYHPMQQFRLSASSILNTQVVEPNTINQWREWSGNSILSKTLYNKWFFLSRDLFDQVSENVSLQALFLKGDNNLRHNTANHGLFLLPFIFSLLSGFVFLSKKARVLLFLVFWWLLALIPASVPLETPHALRSLNALVPISIITGIGTALIFSYSFKRHFATVIFRVCFFATILFSSCSFFYYYFTVYPDISADYWQSGYKEVVQSMFSSRVNNEPIWSRVFDTRFYLYVLAFGPYSGSEFLSWPEKNFVKSNLDNVYFQDSQSSEFVEVFKEFGSGIIVSEVMLSADHVSTILGNTTEDCSSLIIQRFPQKTISLCKYQKK